MQFWDSLEKAMLAFTICWIFWIFFSTLRRFLIARAKARLQEKLLQRIDSSESLVALASSDSGRLFLESITVEESRTDAPVSRILFGFQAGIVLLFFGLAMLFLHHAVEDPSAGFIIFGTGAIGLGFGFLTAAAVSLILSRRLGLLAVGSRD